MAVIHLAGALASFLIGGYLLIDSIFAMGLGNVGILYCLNHYDWCQSHNLTGTILAKFGIGIGLLVVGVFIASRSRN